MSDMLERAADGSGAMFYVGEIPWHGLGNALPRGISWTEALTLPLNSAGTTLNWTVESQRVYTSKGVECEGFRAFSRSDNGRVLNVATEKYQAIQNSENISLVGAAFGDAAVLHTGGILRDGRTVWVLAEIPETTIVGETHRRFLLITWSHDASGAVRVIETAVRVVCRNTLSVALFGSKREGITIRHTGDVKAKLQAAHDALSQAYASFNTYAKVAEKLTKVAVSTSDAIALCEKLLPADGAAKAAVALSYNGRGQNGNAAIQGTAYGLLQGITDYVDHSTRAANSKNRVKAFANATLGAGARTKAKALAQLSALVTV